MTVACPTEQSVVTGTLDTTRTCTPLGHPDNNVLLSSPTGVLYEGSVYGEAATALSLGTNVLATLSVGYKLWHYRKILRKYIVIGSQVIRLEKALAMILESGMAYCIIWVRPDSPVLISAGTACRSMNVPSVS